jgi:hypothetical protein
LESLKRIVSEAALSRSQNGKGGQPDLMSDPRFVAGRAKILQEFVWMAGQYTAKIEITTHRPTRIFHFKYRFSLSDDDIKSLKGNDAAILTEGLGVGPAVYATKYPHIAKIE